LRRVIAVQTRDDPETDDMVVLDDRQGRGDDI
jgi:hypothetical protein